VSTQTPVNEAKVRLEQGTVKHFCIFFKQNSQEREKSIILLPVAITWLCVLFVFSYLDPALRL
jgi:hypothetical protein